MAHREGIREYLKDVEVYGLVIDWGAGTKPIEKYLKPSPAVFITVDIRDDVGADIVTDLEKLADMDYGADFAFCLEVIEHVWDADMLLINIRNNLKEGGILYLSQPFMYEVHKGDDRIRYTHHGLKKLLREAGFKIIEIKPTVGDINHAEGYIVKARK